jgi:hypothetical protein
MRRAKILIGSVKSYSFGQKFSIIRKSISIRFFKNQNRIFIGFNRGRIENNTL